MIVAYRRRLLAATALLLSVSPPLQAAPAPDPAAEGAAADGQTLEEVVVTAQKRRENLQQTPISIAVMGAQAIENRHIVSLADLGDGSIPGLKVAPFYSRNSALIVNIRGVGVLSDGNQPARDQGVGVYIDGVYLGRAQGLGTALFDIDNIEVLKGPQGTLFGRNTEGGAINITTKKPSGDFHLNTVASYGNFGAYKGEIHADLPAFADIAVKLDGVIAHRGSFVDNPLSGADGFANYDRHGFHGEALWKPSSNLSADYSFDTSKDSTSSLYLQLLAPGTNKQAVLGTIQAKRARIANVGVPQQPSVGKVSGHRLTLDYDLASNLKVKSISSYRDLTQTQYDNGSAATTLSNGTGNFTNVVFSRYSLAYFKQNQLSQEVQLIGELPRLKFVGGGLYYHEKVRDNAQAFATNQFTDAIGSKFTVLSLDYAAQRIDRASRVKTDSVGAFGQATYTPALADDIFHLTGGLRWTRDSKHGQLYIVNGALPVVFGVSGVRNLDASWSRVDPMVNLAVDVSNDIHVYGKWSTGYKSGGANSRSLQYLAFNPETTSIFEIGAKTEFFDHHARFNIAAYGGDYKNVQVDFQGLYETIVNGVLTRSNRTTTETINAPGKGGLHGVEAELTLRPVTGLTLGGSINYTYVHIPSTVNPFPNAAGVSNPNPVPIYQSYTPKYSASGSVDYERPMKGFTLRAHLDANHESGYFANATDPSYVAANNAANVYQPKGDKSFIVNGNLAFADIAMPGTDAKVTFSIWARNLFNEQHLFYKALSITSGLNGFFNDPRTFGGQVQVKF